jgi:hypothetical protein
MVTAVLSCATATTGMHHSIYYIPPPPYYLAPCRFRRPGAAQITRPDETDSRSWEKRAETRPTPLYLHHRINWTPIVTTTRLAVLHVQDRPPPSLHARFTSPPPRIDFGHTFNTSLAPCMIKHSSQQDGLFAFPSRGGRWKAKQARAATRLPRHSSATDAVRCQLVMDFNPRAPGTCQVRGKRTF